MQETNETTEVNSETQNETQNETVDSKKPELSEEQKSALLEAMLFACGEPLSADLIKQVTGFSDEELLKHTETLKNKLEAENSGIELALVASKIQLRTKSIFSVYLRELKAGGPKKLTAAALETLSIVAYRQPIVKSDIEKIRGVDATPTIKTLMDRNLIKIMGHQATVGQPALYATTDEFLTLFGLNSIQDLPMLREIGEIEKDPGETEELSHSETEEAANTQEPAPSVEAH